MDKRENTISQIYLLSLDTFMIMTVMGITLGIIFFILNPTLNSGAGLTTPKSEFRLGPNKYLKVKSILSRYGCDIVQDETCKINVADGNALQITLEEKFNENKIFTFILYNKEEEVINDKLIRYKAIREVGLSILL